MNIENALNYGISILKTNRIPNPQIDSEILLSKSINKDKKHILLNTKEILSSKQFNNFNSFIERRRKGEPIAYLIIKKNFGKMSFMSIKMC